MNNFLKKLSVISGGQTGVDRAALDAAMEYGIMISGYCPLGRLAEDGIIDNKYLLIETKSSFYQERTRKNVDMAQGVIIITRNGKISGGTALCLKYTRKIKKPFLLIDLCDNQFAEIIEHVIDWLNSEQIYKINIAGNRESASPGIYDLSFSFLSQLFMELLSIK
jgi:predicted Rossmann-fold nucleotide-binding protein